MKSTKNHAGLKEWKYSDSWRLVGFPGDFHSASKIETKKCGYVKSIIIFKEIDNNKEKYYEILDETNF